MASSSWWTKNTLAVVTGANKGIGFEIAKQLALNGLTVIVTARDQPRGLHALDQLKALTAPSSPNLVFHSLDVQSSESIAAFAAWLAYHYEGIDILVNNAGVIDNGLSLENARWVLDTNYMGVKRVIKALLPYMKASDAGARIVNVSSMLGQLQGISPVLRREMENAASLTEEKIDSFVDCFLQDVEEGNAGAKGWPSGEFAAYRVSKLAVNAYTRVLVQILENEPSNRKVYVNCIHPGVVKTDMSKEAGILSPAEGADTAVWLALLPPPVPTGQFFHQRKPIDF